MIKRRNWLLPMDSNNMELFLLVKIYIHHFRNWKPQYDIIQIITQHARGSFFTRAVVWILERVPKIRDTSILKSLDCMHCNILNTRSSIPCEMRKCWLKLENLVAFKSIVYMIMSETFVDKWFLSFVHEGFKLQFYWKMNVG